MTCRLVRPVLATAGCALALAACTPAAGPVEPLSANGTNATNDTATRTTPVVPGRPARVFVYAALGEGCKPLPAPVVRITVPPVQGDVSFREGQQTTLVSAGSSACAGRSATGTGVYYTAREGAAGSDRFTVEAEASDGTRQTRSFEVRIEP